MTLVLCPHCREETARFSHDPDRCAKCGKKPTEKAVLAFQAALRESEAYSDVSYLHEEPQGRSGEGRRRSKGRSLPRALRALSDLR